MNQADSTNEQQSPGQSLTGESENFSTDSPSTGVSAAKSQVNLLYLLSVLGVVVSSVAAVLLSLRQSTRKSVSLALSSSETPGWLVITLRNGTTIATHEEDLPATEKEKSNGMAT